MSNEFQVIDSEPQSKNSYNKLRNILGLSAILLYFANRLIQFQFTDTEFLYQMPIKPIPSFLIIAYISSGLQFVSFLFGYLTNIWNLNNYIYYNIYLIFEIVQILSEDHGSDLGLAFSMLFQNINTFIIFTIWRQMVALQDVRRSIIINRSYFAFSLGWNTSYLNLIVCQFCYYYLNHSEMFISITIWILMLFSTVLYMKLAYASTKKYNQNFYGSFGFPYILSTLWCIIGIIISEILYL